MAENLEHERGMEAARAYAQWHIGDPSWADLITRAANNPDATWAQLAEAGMQRAKRHLEEQP